VCIHTYGKYSHPPPPPGGGISSVADLDRILIGSGLDPYHFSGSPTQTSIVENTVENLNFSTSWNTSQIRYGKRRQHPLYTGKIWLSFRTSYSRIQIRSGIELKSRIRMRIKMVWIRNTGYQSKSFKREEKYEKRNEEEKKCERKRKKEDKYRQNRNWKVIRRKRGKEEKNMFKVNMGISQEEKNPFLTREKHGLRIVKGERNRDRKRESELRETERDREWTERPRRDPWAERGHYFHIIHTLTLLLLQCLLGVIGGTRYILK
jgi:hypothetical protein